MKRQIKSAELERYNANNRGNNVGDCVKRSISLAFDIPYSEVGKLLVQKMKQLRYSEWNKLPVFKSVIRELGAGDKVTIEDQEITVNDFADQHPSGIYLLLSGKTKGRTSHAVTIRDGKVWDSWDSRNYLVQSYWEIDSSNRKAIRDTDKVYMEDIGHNFAIPAVNETIIKYITKKKWRYNDLNIKLMTSNYQILVKCNLQLAADDLLTKNRDYSFNIMLVIEPTWTEVEIVDFVQKIGKQRAYDRMWTINEQEKKLREAAEIENQIGQKGKLDDMYLTEQEERFINSLPGWVKPLIGDIQIQEPGKYIDSYRLKMYKLPGDDRHPDIRYFYLEGETASDIRTMLNEYKQNYDIEGIDYSYWDRY